MHRFGVIRSGALALVLLLCACSEDDDPASAGRDSLPADSPTPANPSPPVDERPPVDAPPPIGEAPDGTPPDAQSSNRPPTIGGTPPAQALLGDAYAFTPSAADADGDALTFSITNKPAWATFNTATGTIAGAPNGAHVGTTSGIVISVSDGRATTALPAFSITVPSVRVGAATLSWLPPVANEDGSALTDLAGYRIYWGTSPGDYSFSHALDTPGVSTYVVENLVPGTYYFVVTAVNGSGIESRYSNVASKTID